MLSAQHQIADCSELGKSDTLFALLSILAKLSARSCSVLALLCTAFCTADYWELSKPLLSFAQRLVLATASAQQQTAHKIKHSSSLCSSSCSIALPTAVGCHFWVTIAERHNLFILPLALPSCYHPLVSHRIAVISAQHRTAHWFKHQQSATSVSCCAPLCSCQPKAFQMLLVSRQPLHC